MLVGKMKSFFKRMESPAQRGEGGSQSTSLLSCLRRPKKAKAPAHNEGNAGTGRQSLSLTNLDQGESQRNGPEQSMKELLSPPIAVSSNVEATSTSQQPVPPLTTTIMSVPAPCAPSSSPTEISAAPSLTPSVTDLKTDIEVECAKPSLWLEAKNIVLQSQDSSTWKALEDKLPSDDFTIEDVLEGLRDRKATIEEQQWGLVMQNGQKIVLRDVIDKTIGWACTFKDIGSSIAAFDPTNHVGLAWGGIQVLVTAAVKNKDTRHFVLDEEPIAKLIARYAIVEELYLSDQSLKLHATKPRLTDAIVQMYAKVLSFQAGLMEYLTQNKGVHALASLQSLHPIEKRMEDIKTKMLEVEKYLSLADTEGLTDEFKHLKTKLDAFDCNISRAVCKIEGINEALEENKTKEILEWVSSIYHKDHHEEHSNESRIKNSGQWLLNHQQYRDWRLASYSSYLWLSGKVGSGKSTLASIVIDDLFARIAGPTEERLAYFYCKRAFRPSELENPSTILRSIVKQLSRFQNGPIMNTVVKKYKENIGASHLNSKECIEIIRDLTNRYPVTTIIIDGLDEAPIGTRSNLLTHLHEVMAQSHSLVKIFVASRRVPDIEHRFKGFEEKGIASNLRMQDNSNNRDIERFVDTKLDEDIRMGRLLPGIDIDDEFRGHIAETLVSKAQGMFLWVKLSLHAICDEGIEAGVYKRLGTLPQELEELYQLVFDMMKAKSEVDKLIVRSMLTWLIYCQRRYNSRSRTTRLSTKDLLEAVETRSDCGRLRPDTILKLCHNLVEWDEDNGFRFVHLSVREFLVKQDDFEAPQGHSLIAETLWTILNRAFASADASNTRANWVEGLMLYAREYFLDHCQVGYRFAGSVRTIIASFLSLQPEINPIFAKWVQTIVPRPTNSSDARCFGRSIDGYPPYQDAASVPPNPLFAISKWGFADMLGDLSLITKKQLTQNNLYGKSPLSLACQYCNEMVAKRLIKRMRNLGLLFSKPDTRGYTALHIAARYGHLDMVQLLLDEGFDVNTYTRRSPLPSQIPCPDLPAVIQIQGIAGDIFLDITEQVTPLHLASGAGHLDVTKLLLPKSALVDAMSIRSRPTVHFGSLEATSLCRFRLHYPFKCQKRVSKIYRGLLTNQIA